MLGTVVAQANRNETGVRLAAAGDERREVEVLGDDDESLRTRQIEYVGVGSIDGEEVAYAPDIESAIRQERHRQRRNILIGEVTQDLDVGAALLGRKPCAVGGGVTDIVFAQFRVSANDLCRCHASRGHAQDDRHSDARPADGRLPHADIGVDGDTIEFHKSLLDKKYTNENRTGQGSET